MQDLNVTLYRYHWWANTSEACLYEFKPIKATYRGWWIEDASGAPRFILAGDGCGKRYAYPNKADALASFLKRKSHYVAHCQERLRHAQEALAWAQAVSAGKEPPIVRKSAHFNFQDMEPFG